MKLFHQIWFIAWRLLLEIQRLSSNRWAKRQISPQDFNAFEYFVVMDNMNLEEVRALGAPASKVSRLEEQTGTRFVFRTQDCTLSSPHST